MSVAKIKILLYRLLVLVCLVMLAVVAFNKYMDEPWYLFYLDIGMGFADNRAYIVRSVIIILLLAAWMIWTFLGLTGSLRLNWEITVGRRSWNYYNCKYIDRIYKSVICLCIILLCTASFNIYTGFKGDRRKDSWDGGTVIGHSFGEVDGHTYTGTLEAFEYNYQKGVRVFEVDLEITSDEKVVLRHDWDHEIQEGVSSADIPTQEEFLSIPILGQYTPLSFEDLCRIMTEYPDIWVVTDSKYAYPDEVDRQFSLMKSTALTLGVPEILDRLIVQIYNEEMYEAVRNVHPFKSYIFTLYQRWFGDEQELRQICRWCAQNGINVIAMHKYLVNEEIIGITKDYNLNLYIHTENDIEKARAFLDAGISGIYTDKIRPSDLEE